MTGEAEVGPGGPQDAGARFAALHEAFFVMPNPWDRVSTHLLAGLGFKALASSSAALAWTLGRPDGAVTGREAIDHAADIAKASGLPVNGDFEAGYGSGPEGVAETVRAAIDAGIAGCSIEDFDRAAGGLYEEGEACRRLEAAANAVARSSASFVLTGRCEAFLSGDQTPLDTVLRRLKRYAQAGAGVLYAPGLKRSEEVEAVVQLTGLPVNVLAGLGGVSDDLPALKALGVRRISLGSNLARTALSAFEHAASGLAEGRVALDKTGTHPDKLLSPKR